ncbi:uncharacterized protein METZ01_LOCUS180428 [marine metagenome]|uniref:Uncharacterized protein n=1 Tax=marine metagenome TaxID=408172 RepID=A0A382CP34_9ZZZZ|tara:strand:+ start:233 stop:784 length:552 start_codon:yes stop_codon:yes gene_type:complete
MVRIPPWSREETILALYAYMNHGRVRENSYEAKELSTYLRYLTDPQTTSDPVKFRNPDAIALKLRKFAALDPGEASGMQKGSRMELAIWEEFSSNPGLLSREAEKIISSINIPAKISDPNSKSLKVSYVKNTVNSGKEAFPSIGNKLRPLYRSARKHPLKIVIGSAFGLLSTAAAVLLIKKKK